MGVRRRSRNEELADGCGADSGTIPERVSLRDLRGDMDYDRLDDPRRAYEELSSGATLAELALVLHVLPDTLRAWVDKYAEFASMVRQGLEVSRAWWERVGRANLGNRNFNNTLFKFFMAERFGALGNSPVNNLGRAGKNTYSVDGGGGGDGGGGDLVGGRMTPGIDEWSDAVRILNERISASGVVVDGGVVDE